MKTKIIIGIIAVLLALACVFLLSCQRKDYHLGGTEMDWEIGVPMPESDLFWRLGKMYSILGTETKSVGKERNRTHNKWTGRLTSENGVDLSLSLIMEWGKPGKRAGLSPNIDLDGKISSTNMAGCTEWMQFFPLSDLLFVLIGPSHKTDYRKPYSMDISQLLDEKWSGSIIYFPLGVETNNGTSYQIIRFFVNGIWGENPIVVYHADGLVKSESKTQIMLSAEINSYTASGLHISSNHEIYRGYLVDRRSVKVSLLDYTGIRVKSKFQGRQGEAIVVQGDSVMENSMKIEGKNGVSNSVPRPD